MRNEKKVLSKTSRVLSIFHLFCYCQEVSFNEFPDLIPISRKTFERDIAFLEQAGLLDIRYSRRAEAYVPASGGCMICSRPPRFPESKPQRQFMEKIIRLTTMMQSLKEDTDPAKWYRENYPELSTRTMQRDFAELGILGYRIHPRGIIDFDGDKPFISSYCDFPDGESSAYELETFNEVPFIPPSHRRSK